MNTSQEKILFEKCCNNGISIENIDQPFYHQKFNVLASSIDMELKEAPKDFLLRMTDQKAKEKNSKDEAQHKELLLKQQREDNATCEVYSQRIG